MEQSRRTGGLEGRGVAFICDIKFHDAESNKTIFSGVANITSLNYERSTFAAWGGYYNFTYHLHTAAFNAALVLLKIMVDGNLQPLPDGKTRVNMF